MKGLTPITLLNQVYDYNALLIKAQLVPACIEKGFGLYAVKTEPEIEQPRGEHLLNVHMRDDVSCKASKKKR
jgi:hypothetical protein